MEQSDVAAAVAVTHGWPSTGNSYAQPVPASGMERLSHAIDRVREAISVAEIKTAAVAQPQYEGPDSAGVAPQEITAFDECVATLNRLADRLSNLNDRIVL